MATPLSVKKKNNNNNKKIKKFKKIKKLKKPNMILWSQEAKWKPNFCSRCQKGVNFFQYLPFFYLWHTDVGLGTIGMVGHTFTSIFFGVMNEFLTNCLLYKTQMFVVTCLQELTVWKPKI